MNNLDKTWWITFGDNSKGLKCVGDTLENAVIQWGKEHPNKAIKCGVLVEVTHKGETGYWSGKKFLELITSTMDCEK